MKRVHLPELALESNLQMNDPDFYDLVVGRHPHEIIATRIPKGKLKEVLEWCEDVLQGHFSVFIGDKVHRFHFELQQDAFTFKLAWG
jgi:hypothetical protein